MEGLRPTGQASTDGGPLLAFVDDIGDIVYNSIRKSDDTLDSSPLEVTLHIQKSLLARFLPLLPAGSEDETTGSTAGRPQPATVESAIAHRERELADVLSRHVFVESCYFDGSQPYVYCEDPPFLKAADPLDTAVLGVVLPGSTQARGHAGQDGATSGHGHVHGAAKRRRHGAAQAEHEPAAEVPDPVALTVAVQRAFPLSSSHMGKSFRLAACVCVPGQAASSEGNNAQPTVLVAFSRPFKVLAKQGTHGSKPKLVHPSRFERLSSSREAVLRAVLAAAAVSRDSLVPLDKGLLDRSSAVVDGATVDPDGALGGVEGVAPEAASSSAAGGMTPAVEHAHDLPVPFPRALQLLEQRLKLRVVGAPDHIPAPSATGGTAGYTHAMRAPRPRRPGSSGTPTDGRHSTAPSTRSSSAASDWDRGQASAEGRAEGFGASKRPRRSAALVAQEQIRKTLAGGSGSSSSRDEDEDTSGNGDGSSASSDVNAGQPQVVQGPIPHPALPPAYLIVPTPRIFSPGAEGQAAKAQGRPGPVEAARGMAMPQPRQQPAPAQAPYVPLAVSSRMGRAGVGTPPLLAYPHLPSTGLTPPVLKPGTGYSPPSAYMAQGRAPALPPQPRVLPSGAELLPSGGQASSNDLAGLGLGLSPPQVMTQGMGLGGNGRQAGAGLGRHLSQEHLGPSPLDPGQGGLWGLHRLPSLSPSVLESQRSEDTNGAQPTYRLSGGQAQARGAAPGPSSSWPPSTIADMLGFGPGLLTGNGGTGMSPGPRGPGQVQGMPLPLGMSPLPMSTPQAMPNGMRPQSSSLGQHEAKPAPVPLLVPSLSPHITAALQPQAAGQDSMEGR